jgi:hypothetical protein
MIETGNLVEAMAFLSSLPKELVNLPSVELMQLEIMHGMGVSIETIRLAVARIGAGRSDERTFEILIEHSIRSGRPESVIERLFTQAEELFPEVDWKSKFQNAEKGTSPAPQTR